MHRKNYKKMEIIYRPMKYLKDGGVLMKKPVQEWLHHLMKNGVYIGDHRLLRKIKKD